jgi:hypothetical protein
MSSEIQEISSPRVSNPENGSSRIKKIVSIQDQSSKIPSGKLFLVILSLICAIFLSSFEQVSVSTTLPGIAREFGSSTSISWVGTAFLVATSFATVELN